MPMAASNATQLAWLQEDLNTTQPDDFIVVSFHRPAWSVRWGRPDRWEDAESVRDNFHELFVDHGVDLVFSGHDHYYYQTTRDDTYYVTTGGGGAPLTDYDPLAPTWQEGDTAFSTHHFCNVEVNATHVQVTALDTTGSLQHAFAIPRPAPPTTPATLPPFMIEVIIISIVGLVIVIALVVYIKRRNR